MTLLLCRVPLGSLSLRSILLSHTCQVTLDVSGSPIEIPWGSRKYPGYLDMNAFTAHGALSISTLRPRQNGRHLADAIFFNENV